MQLLLCWPSWRQLFFKQLPLDWWVDVNKKSLTRFFAVVFIAFGMQSANLAMDEKTRDVAYPMFGAASGALVLSVVVARCALSSVVLTTVIVAGLLLVASQTFLAVVVSDDIVYRMRSQPTAFFLWAITPASFGFPLVPAAVLIAGVVVLDNVTLFMCQVFHGDPYALRITVSSVSIALGCLGGAWMQMGRLRSIYDIQHELSVEKGLMESMLAMMCDATVWLSDDGSTVARADPRFQMLVGRSAAGERLTDSLPEEEHGRVQDCLQRARTSPVLLPTTLLSSTDARLPVEIFVVGNRNTSKADGAKEQTPAFLIGVKVTGMQGLAESGSSEVSPEQADMVSQRVAEQKNKASAAEELRSCAELQSCAQLESLPETTATGRIFDRLDVDKWLQGTPEDQAAELRSNLSRVDALGQAEHWLIRQTELEIEPDQILGSGSFGFVMAGWLHGSPVAVKAAKRSEGLTASRLLAILNEIRILRHVRHPSIVLCHGSCVEPERAEVLLVLERVKGPDLKRYVLEHSADAEIYGRLQLLLDVACALRYLHAQNPVILHGDLKGSNVLVEAAVPRAKLVDFGLSRLLTRGAKPLGGSLAWMAPELIKHATTPKTSADVFSFGRLVFLMIACRAPLEGVRPEIIKEMARSGLEPILDWDRDKPLSKEAVELCKSALSLVPERRPEMHDVHRRASAWELPGLEEKMPALELVRAAPRQGGGAGSGGLARAVRSLRAALGGAAPTQAPPGRAPGGAAGGAVLGAASGAGGAVPEGVGPHASPPASGGRDTSGSSRSRALARLALPEQPPTQPYAKAYMLLEVLRQWNYPVRSHECCGYHAAIADLASMIRKLKGVNCWADFAPHSAHQCRVCGVLYETFHDICLVCETPGSQDLRLASIQEDLQEDELAPPDTTLQRL